MTQPLISFCILNWNGEELIQECIESLLRTHYSPFEILVVDNASTDNSCKIISCYPTVRLISSPKNLGYAGGNNLGFQHCRGKYIATLNNDIIVEPTWLDDVHPILEQNEDIGIIACRQMNYYNRTKIDSLYTVLTSHLLLGRFDHGKYYSTQNDFHSSPGYVIGANGASAIYRKKLIDDLGGFEESFFAYQEENDLQMRSFYKGWRCFYIPSAVVYHKGSYSFNKRKNSFYYYHERNRIWFIYRSFPLSLILRFLPQIVYREIRTMLNMVIIKKIPHIYIQCRIDGFTGMFKFNNFRKKNLSSYIQLSKTLRLFFEKKKLAPQASLFIPKSDDIT